MVARLVEDLPCLEALKRLIVVVAGRNVAQRPEAKRGRQQGDQEWDKPGVGEIGLDKGYAPGVRGWKPRLLRSRAYLKNS
jgi:hypothetical protein